MLDINFSFHLFYSLAEKTTPPPPLQPVSVMTMITHHAPLNRIEKDKKPYASSSGTFTTPSSTPVAKGTKKSASQEEPQTDILTKVLLLYKC